MLFLASNPSPRALRARIVCMTFGALVWLVAPHQAFAAPRLARLISIRTEHGPANRIKIQSLSKASALTLRLVVPGTGITTLNVQKVSESRGSRALLQGVSLAPLRSRNRSARFGKRWAAVSLADGKQITLNFATPGPHGSSLFFALKAGENARAFRIVRAPHYALANKGCLSSDHSTHLSPDAEPLTAGSELTATRPATGRVTLGKNFSIATVADHLWALRYGASADSQIQTITNSASAIYARDLGMRISVSSQKVETSPTSYPGYITSSEQFLERVASRESLRGSNGLVAFTARSFDEGVIGLAYVASICREPGSSYATVQRFQDALDPVILAHELGHTLSASHTSSGIMTSSLSPANPPTSFSSASIDQIAYYTGRYGSCMSWIGVPPTATPIPTATPRPTSSSGDSSSQPSSGSRIRFSADGTRIILRPSLTNPGGSCRFILKAGTSERNLFLDGIVLRSLPLEAVPPSLTATLRKRTRISTKIFLRGYLTCPGTHLSQTNLIWFDAAKVPVTSKTSAVTFIRELKRRLKEG